ncbi:MAG: hypothetical protein WC794_03510 [Candidatus Doudnabacteria bacterium]|jgi:hypothetical protein
MFRIRFEVPPGFFQSQIAPKVWATLFLWKDDSAEFQTIEVSTCDVEELGGRRDSPPHISQKFLVGIRLANNTDGVEAGQESAEKLAEMLGLEFDLPKPPVVGFEADKS